MSELPSVFLSYAREDRERVEGVYDLLEEEGADPTSVRGFSYRCHRALHPGPTGPGIRPDLSLSLSMGEKPPSTRIRSSVVPLANRVPAAGPRLARGPAQSPQ